MTVSEVTVHAADGTPLVQRTWEPDEKTVRTGSILLVHGLGEHARRYDHVAAVLTLLGLEVRAWDQRGFGRSGGKPATLPHASALVEDAALMFDRLSTVRRTFAENQPPFLLGHSMGGAIAAYAVTSGAIAPRGLILSSPALLPRLSLPQRWAAAVGSRILPNLRVPHRLPMERISHDPDVVAAVKTDPDIHDRATPRLVAFMRSAGRAAIEGAPVVSVPTLLLVAGDDRLVDPEGARRFHAHLADGFGTLKVYDGLYHEVFNEREADRARVLADLTAWLRQQLVVA